MDDIKSVLLETLSEFHSFCETHNLEYFLIGGTLLGAVRHEGFIPWDDDADVVMPREDYNKLLNLANEFNYPFTLKSPKTHKDFRIQFAKLTNDKIILEENQYVPFINGVWVDIFPLDYTFDNRYAQKIHFFVANKLLSLIYQKYNLVDNKRFSLTRRTIKLPLWLISKLSPRQAINYLFTINENIATVLPIPNNNLANLYGSWGSKEVAPSEIFSSKKLYSFENKYFWGPENADYWLTKVYGNYMQIPSEEQRKSKHNLRILEHNYAKK